MEKREAHRYDGLMVTKVDGKSHEVDPDEKRRIADHILAEVSLGRSVSKIFEEEGDAERLCSPATWYRWLVGDQSLRDELASAREAGCEKLVEEMVTIADDKTGDPDAQSRRVRIYAREKAAQMLAPRRFGQKLDVTSGGKPIEGPKSVTLIDNRIQSVLMLVQQRKDADHLRTLLE